MKKRIFMMMFLILLFSCNNKIDENVESISIRIDSADEWINLHLSECIEYYEILDIDELISINNLTGKLIEVIHVNSQVVTVDVERLLLQELSNNKQKLRTISKNLFYVFISKLLISNYKIEIVFNMIDKKDRLTIKVFQNNKIVVEYKNIHFFDNGRWVLSLIECEHLLY